jgi:hypothetical protein
MIELAPALMHFSIDFELINDFRLSQGSQTRDPRAAYGLPDAFVRSVNNSKTDKNINFNPFRAFIVNCGPQKLFSNKLRPAEAFFLGNAALQYI